MGTAPTGVVVYDGPGMEGLPHAVKRVVDRLGGGVTPLVYVRPVVANVGPRLVARLP